MSTPIAATQSVVFSVRDVTKVYRMGDVEVHALKGVTMELFKGESVVLLGPFGSGKSTLLNIVGGLDTPSTGSVRFLEHDLTTSDDWHLTQFRRKHVGFVFQFYT